MRARSAIVGLHNWGHAKGIFRVWHARQYKGVQTKGVARGGPGVPVTPLCKPFLRKQPIIFRGENAMTIMFDTV